MDEIGALNYRRDLFNRAIGDAENEIFARQASLEPIDDVQPRLEEAQAGLLGFVRECQELAKARTDAVGRHALKISGELLADVQPKAEASIRFNRDVYMPAVSKFLRPVFRAMRTTLLPRRAPRAHRTTGRSITRAAASGLSPGRPRPAPSEDEPPLDPALLLGLQFWGLE